MKKSGLKLLIFLLLFISIIPALINTLKIEKSGKTVITSIIINNVNNDILNFLANKKSLKNTKSLVLYDKFLLDSKNKSYLNMLKSNGYNLGISLDLSYKNANYFENLSEIIKEYNIQNIYFEEKTSEMDINSFKELIKIAKDNKVIIGLVENIQENGLQYQKLVNFSSEFSDISNRALFTYKSDIISLNEKDLTFRLLRSVVDRGIRSLAVEGDNVQDILYYDKVFGSLNKELQTKGYYLENEMVPVNPPAKNILYFLILSLFIILITLNLLEIMEIKRCYIIFILTAFLLLIVFLYLYSYDFSMIFLTFLITVAVPSSVTIALYKALAIKDTEHSYFTVFFYNMKAFLIYIISGCFIWLAMSSFNFRIGFITYKLSIFSYILPLVITLLYILRSKGYKINIPKKALYSIKAVAITLLTVLLIYIYLSRSGNYTIFPASALELKLRILLEKTLPARPRSKEFLLGYPCIFIAFIVNEKRHRILSSYILLGSAITSISILNTFCHVFTPINISLIREFYGFIFGILTGTASYVLLKYFHLKGIHR